MTRRRPRISPSVKQRLLKSVKRCYYCNVQMPKPNRTVDHKHPLVMGGRNKVENLVVACAHCNLLKGGMVIYEFESLLLRVRDTNSATLTTWAGQNARRFIKRAKKNESGWWQRLESMEGAGVEV